METPDTNSESKKPRYTIAIIAALIASVAVVSIWFISNNESMHTAEVISAFNGSEEASRERTRYWEFYLNRPLYVSFTNDAGEDIGNLSLVFDGGAGNHNATLFYHDSSENPLNFEEHLEKISTHYPMDDVIETDNPIKVKISLMLRKILKQNGIDPSEPSIENWIESGDTAITATPSSNGESVDITSNTNSLIEPLNSISDSTIPQEVKNQLDAVLQIFSNCRLYVDDELALEKPMQLSL